MHKLPKITVIYRSSGELKPDPANPRIHSPKQVKQIAVSIKAFGFNVPVLVDRNDYVIAGHGRLLACQQLGITQVPTICLDNLTPHQVTAFRIADNRLTDTSVWDDKLLAEQLKALSLSELDFSLEAIGFDMGEIDFRIQGLDSMPEDEDDTAELPLGPAVTKLSDLWLLGPHRLLCGNALESRSYETLMQGKVADMVISDLPYNVQINGHAGGNGRIKHREFAMASGEMTPAEFTQFLRTCFALLVLHSSNGSVHALFMDWNHMPEMLTAGNAVYSRLLNMCVWVKHQAGMGSLYRSQHELVFIYKSGTASHQNHIQLGRFGRHRSNVWEYPGIQAMRHGEEGDLLAMHPTVKPIKLIADAMLDCSSRGDIVLDPFTGSGTIILAAERVGRLAYGMELDPLYVDTAIRRWQNLTGQQAIHASTGERFSQREAAVEAMTCHVEVVHG
ncbi:DNA methyltransferase [Methylotenera sp. 1P/1]|uniref:site-specific DNA-methyltransferase n=1 Tax=Methylotenera sp. 1P/1 TaxID=1131551 RepID=UPI0003673925|nr:DNA methyltransferase [Methylotenera sp. 1P/1]